MVHIKKMQIILIRHAKVLINYNKKIKADDINSWINIYNNSPIDKSLPDINTLKDIKNSHYLVVSNLKRTKESLELIDLTPNELKSLFNEIELIDINLPILKLQPKIWLIIIRFIMIFKIKPILKAQNRAKKACDYLEKLAKKHKNIALVGHGAFNWLIFKELKKEIGE